MEKRCTKCGIVKLVSEFSKHKQLRDGLQPRCKTCGCEDRKVYYEANREKVRASQKVYQKVYRLANLEKECARKRAHYEANRENYHANARAYRESNPEKIYAIQKAFRERNPEKHRAARGKRRALYAGAAGQASAEQRAARWDYYGGCCYICGKDAEAMDHVIPLARGGSNWPANLRPICGSCNSTKGAKWPYDIEQVRLEATT